MCIRDSTETPAEMPTSGGELSGGTLTLVVVTGVLAMLMGCLLYTSDAADERSSVDLGGRRIIKKKNRITTRLGDMVRRKSTVKERR